MAAKKISKPHSTSTDAERLYTSLRRVEEEIARISPSDKIKSPVHLSIGQEGVAVGVCDPLKPRDAVSGAYRGFFVGNHPWNLTPQIETLRQVLDGVIR